MKNNSSSISSSKLVSNKTSISKLNNLQKVNYNLGVKPSTKDVNEFQNHYQNSNSNNTIDSQKNNYNNAHLNVDSSNSQSGQNNSNFHKMIDSNVFNNKFYRDANIEKDVNNSSFKSSHKKDNSSKHDLANSENKPKMRLLDVLKESESARKKDYKIQSNLLKHYINKNQTENDYNNK